MHKTRSFEINFGYCFNNESKTCDKASLPVLLGVINGTLFLSFFFFFIFQLLRFNPALLSCLANDLPLATYLIQL